MQHKKHLDHGTSNKLASNINMNLTMMKTLIMTKMIKKMSMIVPRDDDSDNE